MITLRVVGDDSLRLQFLTSLASICFMYRDVMERNVYALYDRSKVSDLVRILKEHKHGCFPVTAKYLEPVGLASDGAFPRVPIVVRPHRS